MRAAVGVLLGMLALPGIASGRAVSECPTGAQMASVPAPYVAPFVAVPVLNALREKYPDCVALDLAAAREGAAAGILDSVPDSKMAWIRGAVSAARHALALDSARADTHYWLAATTGLEADNAGGRTKIVCAREAWMQAERTLAIDPRNAGAHYIIGRLHAGVERLPWVERLIARALGLGPVLSQASWQSAERELRLAVQLDTTSLVDKVELAKVLIERGQRGEGDSILRNVAERTPHNELDAYYVRLAASLSQRHRH